VLPGAVLLAALALAGCTDSNLPGSSPSGSGTATTSPAGTPTSGAPATDVQVSDLVANPSAYLGKRVRVSGVADYVAPFVCTIGATAATPGATATLPTATTTLPTATTEGTATASATAVPDRIVVLHRNVTGPQDGQQVTVTGTVSRGVDLRAVAQALGINIDDSIIRQLGAGTEFFVQADDLSTS
jgi:hypothetical protein